jgi:hypothetical protein
VAQSSQFNQSNTINWYQQTWHTIEFSNNRHTRHHHNNNRGSLRSNFSNLPGSGPRCKSRFQDPHQQPNQPHPDPQRTKRQPDPGLESFRGFAASGSQHSRWSPSRRLRKQYTHPNPTATPLWAAAPVPLTRATKGLYGYSGLKIAPLRSKGTLCFGSPLSLPRQHPIAPAESLWLPVTGRTPPWPAESLLPADAPPSIGPRPHPRCHVPDGRAAAEGKTGAAIGVSERTRLFFRHGRRSAHRPSPA